ncbi:MAG: tRNA (adenosine(37)-N6)-threonylcarbamoyltransferase complex transferase subunit TsaD [Chloroflexi bacterium]|nr:tRNA (adenosine(37)-N6)-threonylcarbamoyltransferase complex transferase subunit TsaD [Chloroflexota bacterium]
MVRILGIETSCDRVLRSNVLATQETLHARYGGVVPEIASRQHLIAITPTIRQAMEQADVGFRDLDAIAVTRGPGLAGALLVGLSAAKAAAWAHGLPLIGVHHMEGHIYANWLGGQDFPFPILALLVSGGHTGLFLMRDHGRYERLGGARADAAGEAFDKTARLLGLGFPGGPAIQRAAAGASSAGLRLPRPMLHEGLDFSFSGLKTAVLRLVEGTGTPDRAAGLGDLHLSEAETKRIAAAFQEAVVDVLVTKTIEAARLKHARQILVGGGVAANLLLREQLVARSPVPVYVAPPALCTDNGAMIAAAGAFVMARGERSPWSLEVSPSLPLT